VTRLEQRPLQVHMGEASFSAAALHYYGPY
jgi:hypothetical protein